MKVKNIMFSGFAAAILMGVVAEASAAPVAVASKGYVDSIAGTIANLDGAANGAENLVEAINVKLDPVDAEGETLADGEYYKTVTQATDGQLTVEKANLSTTITSGNMIAPTTDAVYTAIQGVSGQTTDLDLEQVGADGKYVKLVSQSDGQVSATAQDFDTTIGSASTDANAPTSKAVYTAIQHVADQTSGLDLDQVGGGGKFVKLVSQADGQVSATAEDFDQEVNAETGTHNETAPTTKAVYTAIQNVADQTSDLDLGQVGADGKYVKLVSQSDGQVSATAQDFDTTISSASTDANAPTSKAVYTAIEGVRGAIPAVPAACLNTENTCVLTSEGGEFAWAILTNPVDGSTMTGVAAQRQELPEPVVAVQPQ